MDYFKLNYDRLKNIKEKDFFIVTIIFIIIFVYIIFLSLFIKVSSSVECYGIVDDNLLKININVKLSDKLKKGNKIKFKNTYLNYKIKDYQEYSLIDNEIYQEIDLEVDAKFYSNEVGIVTIYYDEISLCKYILELFK